MFNLHSHYPPICHGHITSHNIFVDFDQLNGMKIYLGDLEVSNFLKYASLLSDYSLISVWSSPEVMKSNKILESTKEMDIYCFGILIW